MSKRFQISGNNSTIENAGKKKSRSIQITGAACMGNFFVGIGKLMMGMYILQNCGINSLSAMDLK